MENHHVSSCNFLLKLRQALLYLGMDLDAGSKKTKNFQKKAYTKNRNFVRSLQDAGFIPYLEADKDIFLDIVEGEQEVFTPTTDGQ